MQKIVKLTVWIAGALVLLLAAAVFIVPHFLDVQKYRPLIEEKIADATGLKASLGGDVDLKLFPRVGLSFKELRLGNPEGFKGEDLLRIVSFETQLKVMPLLARRIEIDRFLLQGFEVNLERTLEGDANWNLRPREQDHGELKTERAEEHPKRGAFKIASVDIGEIALVNGRVTFTDALNGVEHDISGITIRLVNVNLQRPITADIKMVVDGKTFSANGKVGPVGTAPGKGTLPLDLRFDVAEQLQLHVKGMVRDINADLRYRLFMESSVFSPRKLLSALDIALPMEADADVMSSSEFSLLLKGTAHNAAVEDAEIKLDDSTLSFIGESRSFVPPVLVFEGHLDRVDLDRYLTASEKAAGEEGPRTDSGENQTRDYGPLRDLVLDATLTADELKARGGRFDQALVKLSARDGLFRFDPISVNIYGGRAASVLTINVQGDRPETDVSLDIEGVRVGPLLRDMLDRDVLEGAMTVQGQVSTRGDTPAEVKGNLTGGGDIRFQDGAIVGIDLAGMVRNVQSSFGLGETGERPKTDFTELHVPFELANGLFQTAGTSLQSPFIRVSASGSANIVTESLDMRVQPRFVSTMLGQGDDHLRSGLMIPVIVGGTFSAPEFSPDLEEMAKSKMVEEGVKKLLGEEMDVETIIPAEPAESIKKGLKSLLPF